MPGNFEQSVPISEVPYHEPQDTASNWLEAGDYVHARKETVDDSGTPIPPLLVNFVISGINGSRVYGSDHFPDGISQKDGWYFDLLSRPLALPDTISEIDALLNNGQTITLMGKGQKWVSAETGNPVAPEMIVKFETHVDAPAPEPEAPPIVDPVDEAPHPVPEAPPAPPEDPTPVVEDPTPDPEPAPDPDTPPADS